jgi:hypothetical protein
MENPYGFVWIPREEPPGTVDVVFLLRRLAASLEGEQRADEDQIRETIRALRALLARAVSS